MGLRRACNISVERVLSVELRGLEPLTPTLPVWCATSCAIAPSTACSRSCGCSNEVTPSLAAATNQLVRPVLDAPVRAPALDPDQPTVASHSESPSASTTCPSTRTPGVPRAPDAAKASRPVVASATAASR